MDTQTTQHEDLGPQPFAPFVVRASRLLRRAGFACCLAGLILGTACLAVRPAAPPSAPSSSAASSPAAAPAPMGAPASVGTRAFAFWTETWTDPRPVQFYFVRLDLTSPAYEVRALVADDPDGEGPAEAALTDPRVLAQRPGLVAAVNANAFRPIGIGGILDTNWHVGQPVDIVGLAAMDGVVRSQGEAGRDAFWTDRARHAHVGPSTDATDPVQAVGDWNARLVTDGAVVAPATEALHPRTLMGVDGARRWLLLAVADGRQPGYSEGVSLREAAEVLARHGCADGLNLDGGGSSILLVADDAASATLRSARSSRTPSRRASAPTIFPSGETALHVANRPSGGSPRPVPVMLGIARRDPSYAAR